MQQSQGFILAAKNSGNGRRLTGISAEITDVKRVVVAVVVATWYCFKRKVTLKQSAAIKLDKKVYRYLSTGYNELPYL